MRLSEGQRKVEARRRKEDLEFARAQAFLPQRHTSFHAATALLSGGGDVHGAESEQRRQLRERFSFHRETIAPVAQRQEGSSLLPPLVDARGGKSSSNSGINAATSPPSALSENNKPGTSATELFPSLQAAIDAFRPRWKQLFERETRSRRGVEKDHTEGLETLLKDLSRTVDIEAMVRPEVAPALGLTVTVKMTNYLEEEEAAFQLAKSAIFGAEAEHRALAESFLLKEFAALRRSATRQLRQLQAAQQARIAAAELEAAQALERRISARLAQIAQNLLKLVEDEEVRRFVEIALVEFSERHALELSIRQEMATRHREIQYAVFLRTMESHFKFVAAEKSRREVIEGEERGAAAALKDAAAEVDRHYAAFSLSVRIQKHVQLEAMLRPEREALFLRHCLARVFECGATTLFEAASRTLSRLFEEASYEGATPVQFVVFCEREMRAFLLDQQDLFCSEAVACFADPQASTHAMERLSHTPTSDVGGLDSVNRSLVPSRQMSGRRVLWSAGGGSGGVGGGRTSRVPTGDGVRPSRSSTATRSTHPPLPPAKLDL